VDHKFEKWKVCEVVYITVHMETWAIIDSMCFLLKTLDETWDLLENLGWDSYEFEKVRETLGYPTSDPYAFYVNSCWQDEFRDLNAQSFHYIPNCMLICCDHCRSFDHGTNKYSYHMNDADGVNFETMINIRTQKNGWD